MKSVRKVFLSLLIMSITVGGGVTKAYTHSDEKTLVYHETDKYTLEYSLRA
ncbi:MAG: hypothetical protein ACOYVK_12865 [Bacillota bacterium]